MLEAALKSALIGAVSVSSAGNGQLSPATASGFSVSRTVHDAQPKHIAHMAHRNPLCWHRPRPWQKPKERTLSGPAETPSNRATSS